MKNKTYIIYSLVVPLVYILMVFLNFKFGTTTHEYTSRPLGKLSDVITWTIDNLYMVLIVGHIVLYFKNKQYKTLKNKLMVISNSIFGLLAWMVAYQPLVMIAYVIGFLAGGFLLIIGYIVLYISQFRELSSIEDD